MDDEEKKVQGCTGHCENCNVTQRVYCAAQIGLYNQREIAAIKESVGQIMTVLGSIKKDSDEQQICTIHEQPIEKVRIESYE